MAIRDVDKKYSKWLVLSKNSQLAKFFIQIDKGDRANSFLPCFAAEFVDDV